jgi:hypothetical protein
MRLPHDEGSQSAGRTRAGGSKRQGCDTYWTHRFLFSLDLQFTETTNEWAVFGHHRLTFRWDSVLRRTFRRKTPIGALGLLFHLRSSAIALGI